ncbi:MAG TPA: transglycosylase SLT domain-containing protein [Solirubrobacteraceae bacterium]|nr:transglycosylase SLT domain-containing protein [Solirubrobacteraceae bacterium]
MVLILVLLLTGGHRRIPGAPPGGVAVEAHSTDPFSYATSRAVQFTERAAAGNATVLFTKSPGGALATAERVARWRPLIDAAVKGTRIDPSLLEGLVFVESAGRPGVIAGTSVTDAAGLTQILASTATSLLGMHINLARSRSLTNQIESFNGSGKAGQRKLARLVRERQAADPRFDPRAEIDATVRYLQDAERTFGREDLAFASYHMGIGNLQSVLRLYNGGHPVPYVQLYFDTAPDRHGAAFHLLQGFGDDSALYYWRILGAVQIMHLYRTDRAQLRREISWQLADDAGGTMLHPPGDPARWSTPSQLSAAYGRHELVPLPSNASALGLAYDSSLGAQARRISAPRSLYRGLRPVALHELEVLADRIRALSGASPLRVASTVQDLKYQQAAGLAQPLAATGWQFEIARHYRSGAQAGAFQELLDRLQSLDLIAWAPDGAVIDITVASDAQSWRG